MDDFRKPYFILWNSFTDIINMLEQQNYGLAKELLIKAQQEAEETFINTTDE